VKLRIKSHLLGPLGLWGNCGNTEPGTEIYSKDLKKVRRDPEKEGLCLSNDAFAETAKVPLAEKNLLEAP